MADKTLLQQAFEIRKENPNITVGEAVSQVKANTTPATPLPTAPQATLPTAKAGDVVVGVNGEKFVQENNQDLSTNVQGPSQVVNQSGQDMSKLEQVQAQAFGRREGLQTQGVMPNPVAPQNATSTQEAPTTTPTQTTPVAPTPTKTPTVKETPVQIQPTDENSIMSVLKTNGPITDVIKNSPNYAQVKQVYDKVKQFSTYSVNNLVTALNNGAILPGTKVYNEMLNDPSMRQKLTEAQVFKAKQPVNTQEVTQNSSNEILSNNPTTASAFADGTLTPEEYSKLTNTPEVTAKAQDVEAKTNKYNSLKAEYDDIETQVNKDFAGSPFADAIIADRQKAKYKNLVLAKGELDSAIGTLTELKSTAANIFETNLKLYQEQKQQDNAYKMAQYQAQLSKEAAQYQNQLQQGNIKFQTIGNKVYKEQNGQLIDTGLSAATNEWQSTNITRYNPLTGANESTPVFYRKKGTGAGFEAVDLAGNPIDVNLLGGSSSGIAGVSGNGTYSTGNTALRTDRNMNPTAFTTDIAKQAGLVEGVDYVVGDKFPGNSSLHTAKLIGDPIETTIRVIDKIGFKTQGGADRWTYTSKLGLNNDTWSKMSQSEKATAVKRMYQQEGGNGTAIGENKSQPTDNTPSEIKQFMAYDGKTVPEEYKTPLQKQQFIDKYNQWRAGNTEVSVKNGDDILNIQLSDKATTDEKAALKYSSRMLNAANDLKDLENKFLNLPLKDQIYQTYAPNLLKSDDQKVMESRKKDFITAVLRKESGASISPTEFKGEEIKYFPQPGDSQQVITAKQNARNFAIKALLSEAGRDINGNLASSLYIPEAIKPQETQTSSDLDSRLKKLREQSNQK